jgi:hypothetical protein
VTVTPTGGSGTELQQWSDEDLGLEDVGAGDVVLPRLSIKHLDAVFEDNLSKRQYPELEVIVLGLVKQRVMWDADPDDGDKPQCKSPDFDNGFPNTNEDIPKDKRFPWEESNFNPANFAPDPEMNNLIHLPCASCVFQKWGADKTPPPCAEQHTYPLLYNSTPDAPPEEAIWQPALISFQKTGIKPSRSFISGFSQSRTPMFTVHTTIKLQQLSRGQVRYCVPSFTIGDSTDRSKWENFATQYRQIREFIRQPPRGEGEYTEDGGTPPAPSDNTNTGPTVASTTVAQPEAAAPAQPQATPAPEPEAAPPAPPAPAPANDDLPF